MNTRIDRVFRVPETIPAEFRRVFAAYRIGGLSAFAYHAGLLVALLLFSLVELALVNVVSCLLWLTAVRLLGRGRVLAGVNVAMFELFMHAIAASAFLGWAFGFQWYLLFVPVNVFFLPRGRRALKLFYSAATVIVIAGLYLLELQRPPIYDTSPAAATIVFVLNWSILIAVISANVAYYRELADRLEEEIRRQNERAHALLLNILPKSIADRLESESDGHIVSHYPETTILFCDIVRFTELTGELEPSELVELLNELFAGIDTLCDREELEKIKTIGDAYMIAAGCPHEYDDHAERAARCALSIRDLFAASPTARRHDLNVRIGLHTGPVVAGVIGKRKFAFDLWGQTVNVASRMESHGEPGCIHVSEATAGRLAGRFELVRRGNISVKGIGRMTTWFLQGMRPAHSA